MARLREIVSRINSIINLITNVEQQSFMSLNNSNGRKTFFAFSCFLMYQYLVIF